MKSEAGQCEEHASEERWRDVGYQAEQGERRMLAGMASQGMPEPKRREGGVVRNRDVLESQ